MGCAKSKIDDIIPDKSICNRYYEYDYLTYCTKCDYLGINRKTFHCFICNKCHEILQYIYCSVCEICVNPHSDIDIINHRKIHENVLKK
jgi:hypothetical protein